MDVPLSRIAIFYPSLEGMGGIERVVVEQTRIFSEAGYAVLLLTHRPIHLLASRILGSQELLPLDKEERKKKWLQLFEETPFDCLIIHDPNPPCILQDITSVRHFGVRVLLNIHFSFPAPIFINGDQNSYTVFRTVADQCDAVAAVSSADALFWRSLGYSSYFVQNPFVRPRSYCSDVPSASQEKVILWVGRHAEPKQPLEAISVFSVVAKKIPEAILEMVGGSAPSKAIREAVKRGGVEGRVRFTAEAADISSYYRRASLHLLTSLTESFCLVIAEAKAHSLPTVMYDIPFLDLVRDGQGVVKVRRFDREAMAQAVIDLLKNDERRNQMGKDARKTLDRFNDVAVLASWRCALNNEQQQSEISETGSRNHEIVIREILEAWNYHTKKNYWKIDFFDKLEKILGRSLQRCVVGCLARGAELLKRVRRKFGKQAQS